MQKWWVKTGTGAEIGPLSLDEIQKKMLDGEITKDDLLLQSPGGQGIRVQEFILKSMEQADVSSAPLVEPEFKRLSTDSLVQLFDTLQKASRAERSARVIPQAAALKDPEKVEKKVQIFNLRNATYAAILFFLLFSIWIGIRMVETIHDRSESTTQSTPGGNTSAETASPTSRSLVPKQPDTNSWPGNRPKPSFSTRPHFPTAPPRPTSRPAPEPTPEDTPVDNYPDNRDRENDAPNNEPNPDAEPAPPPAPAAQPTTNPDGTPITPPAEEQQPID